MKRPQIFILGCGYTGRRVADRFLKRGYRVIASSPKPEKLSNLAAAGAKAVCVDVLKPKTFAVISETMEPGSLILHSIPLISHQEGWLDPTTLILKALTKNPARLVYLSTTGVYGDTSLVDETTPAAPVSQKQKLRVAAESAVAAGQWSSLMLRPAAIYGPGRGVHESIKAGRFRLAGDGSNFVSRIHVDDLAAIVEAGLLSDITGAYPVADDDPCTSRDMAQYCAGLLELSMPPSAPASELHYTRRANRRVNGTAIRKLLGVSLRYPSYRVGVPASL